MATDELNAVVAPRAAYVRLVDETLQFGLYGPRMGNQMIKQSPRDKHFVNGGKNKFSTGDGKQKPEATYIYTLAKI